MLDAGYFSLEDFSQTCEVDRTGDIDVSYAKENWEGGVYRIN